MSLGAGAGLGWRPETAWACETRRSLAFVEVIAENMPERGPLPKALETLRARGVEFVVHGVSLSLGSGDPPEPRRLARLRRVAELLGAPLVSEHLAFVRGGGHETQHLLPVPRTREAIEVVVDNVRRAQDALRLPLAIENIARLFTWPGDAIPDGEMLAEIAERSDCRILLDASNLRADAQNFGCDVPAFLASLPAERIAYVHLAGGIERDGFFHDTHAQTIDRGALASLEAVLAAYGPLPVLLERDDGFGTSAELHAELDAIERRIEEVKLHGSG